MVATGPGRYITGYCFEDGNPVPQEGPNPAHAASGARLWQVSAALVPGYPGSESKGQS